MSDKDSVRRVIFQPGQSQQDRFAPELEAHYADVDERTPADMLRYAARFAHLLNFYEGESTEPVGDWSPLFPDGGAAAAARVAQADGKLPSHLALYLTFVKLYQNAREAANDITARHANFFYQDVLGLRRRDPVADRAHIVFELKKGAPAVEINPTQQFVAGKDSSGVELVYEPTATSIVNTSRVDSLRSIYVDRTARGIVRFAPIANSSDGLGGKLPPENPQWKPFGSRALPVAAVGFAIASPVLRMKEGLRAITLNLRLSGGDHDRLSAIAAAGGKAFNVYLSGAEGWLEASDISATLGSDGSLRWKLTVPEGASAIVDYNPDVHGYSYSAAAPVVQFVLRGDNPTIGYFDFSNVVLKSASVAVDVSGVTSMALENDSGTLDPKKAFLPFGAQPTEGARLMVAYPEALGKRLSSLALSLQWKDAPASFSQRYSLYNQSITNDSFTAAARFHDANGTAFTDDNCKLFASPNAKTEVVMQFKAGGNSPPDAMRKKNYVDALQVSNTNWGAAQATRMMLATPVIAAPFRKSSFQQAAFRPDILRLVEAFRIAFATPITERQGFITLTLKQSFLHAEYRNLFVAAVVRKDANLPQEPYTPTVQHIALSYSAFSEDVQISSNLLEDFSNPDVQFFQVTPFGPRREHGYQRARFSFVPGTDVPLLPEFSDDGELLIGLADLVPGDSVSLLIEAAAGSADPELARQPIHWSVLCDDYWKPLSAQELVRDTTNGLLTSGIVGVVIADDATTTHNILPAQRIWIRASVAREVAAVSQLLEVAANGIEVRFADQGNASQHLESALPALLIAKARSAIAGVKTVKQPYASFGGRPRELERNFRARAAERLRHKDRCITPWDYERIVLEAFPGVHRVKCVPHASEKSWSAPGHVTLVVVPDIRNGNSVDPLRPRVDADTLSRIRAYVQARCGMQVHVHVKNPQYQRIRVQFGVSFRVGREFNHYRGETEKELIRALSPWAFMADREIMFGGTIYRSVLLNVVERLPYVDYITDFRMYVSSDDAPETPDVAEIQPGTPDTILVSAPTHIITSA